MANFDPLRYLKEPRWQHSRPGLSRIQRLMFLLGNPQRECKYIHVAGTNGKGSICAYTSSILQKAGYKVGTFTSPYIWNFEERIRINNQVISHKDLCDITFQVMRCAEDPSTFEPDDHPTQFELMTAVGFLYFARKKCDVVVLEVGMGGRLDSTNIIEPDQVVCSVISSISIDHTNFLGDDLAGIAREKAGIIKHGVPVVVGQQQPKAMEQITRTANNLNSKIVQPDISSLDISAVDMSSCPEYRHFNYAQFLDLKTRLIAKYQPYNAIVAIEACKIAAEVGFSAIDNDVIAQGINSAFWPVRFQIVARHPYVLIDGGHNQQGVDVLLESLSDVFPDKHLIFIFGVLADKDYSLMVKTLSKATDTVFTIKPDSPRALEAKTLADEFKKFGVEATCCDSFESAANQALDIAIQEDVICCFGSLYSAARLHDIFQDKVSK